MILKDNCIGLTGGAASGKSTIATILRSLGQTVIDADALSREAVMPESPALTRIVAAFGREILGSDGGLDRRLMRTIVFASEEKRRLLEGIVHPAIQQLLAEKVAAAGLMNKALFWFYEASLIFENQRQNDFWRIWVAICDPELQIKRLMARDHIDRVLAEQMIQSQWPLRKKADMADTVIATDGTLAELEAEVRAAIALLAK